MWLGIGLLVGAGVGFAGAWLYYNLKTDSEG